MINWVSCELYASAQTQTQAYGITAKNTSYYTIVKLVVKINTIWINIHTANQKVCSQLYGINEKKHLTAKNTNKVWGK